MPGPVFPKLTSAQCALVVDWVNAHLRPLADVLTELERPEVLKHLESIGAPRLDPAVKERAAAAYVAVGGSNGAETFKTHPTYRDVDVFFMVDKPDLSPVLSSQLAALLGRRCTPEVLLQRQGCTIEGVALEIEGSPRYLDIGKLGTTYKGVSWRIPNKCRHCDELFYDGRFVGDGQGSFIHESCLAKRTPAA